MPWTRWRKLAEGKRWFDDSFDYDGPACYELATSGPRGGDMEIHYVGETKNERLRMESYGRNGSHLSKIIRARLRRGWTLYYRAWRYSRKAEAKKMQDRRLQQFEYDWNVHGNSSDDDS